MKNIYILFIAFFAVSCMDLDVPPEDASVAQEIFQDPENYRSYLAKIYGAYSLTGQQGPAGQPDISIVNDEGFTSYIRSYWKAQELTTDEAVIAWTDAGIRDLHLQEWSSENQFVRVLYYRIYNIITYANDFLAQSAPDKLDEYGISEEWKLEIGTYRKEARFLRAMAYWHAIDLFRNVPLLTKISTELQGQATPQELFTFIETELNEIEADMVAPKQNEYGRADRAALWMVQAKLYLNAEVYIDQPKYTEAITALNKITAAGYGLHDTYFELFMADNDQLAAPASSSPEVIFALPSDGKRTQGYGNTSFLVHAAIGGTMVPTDYGVGGGWAGLRTTKTMVEKFGPDPLNTSNMDPRVKFYTSGQTLEIAEIGTFTEGYAVQKWVNVTSGGAPGSDLDFPDTDNPIFRLADVYLMYAEAVLRGGAGGDASTALGYVNDLRRRAYGDNSADITLGEMTLDFILDERVRELYWEGTRRQDLIRYGRFTDQGIWPWKGGVPEGELTSSHLNIFPIPASDLNVNSLLVQNDGY